MLYRRFWSLLSVLMFIGGKNVSVVSTVLPPTTLTTTETTTTMPVTNTPFPPTTDTNTLPPTTTETKTTMPVTTTIFPPTTETTTFPTTASTPTTETTANTTTTTTTMSTEITTSPLITSATTFVQTTSPTTTTSMYTSSTAVQGLLPVGVTFQTGEELQTSFGSSLMMGSGTVSSLMTKNFKTAETQWEELKSEISSSQDSITSGSSWIKTAHMPYTATFTATFVKSYSLLTSSSMQPMATITPSPSTFTSPLNFKGDDHSRPDKVVTTDMSVSRSKTNSFSSLSTLYTSNVTSNDAKFTSAITSFRHTDILTTSVTPSRNVSQYPVARSSTFWNYNYIHSTLTLAQTFSSGSATSASAQFSPSFESNRPIDTSNSFRTPSVSTYPTTLKSTTTFSTCVHTVFLSITETMFVPTCTSISTGNSKTAVQTHPTVSVEGDFSSVLESTSNKITIPFITSSDTRSEICDCQQENVFGISCHEASTVVVGLAVTLICYFLITMGCLFCYCSQHSRINGKIQISKLGEENAKLKIKVEKLETAKEQLPPGRSDTSRKLENPEGNSGSSKMPDIENKLCSAVNTIDLINASEVCKNDAENQERFWTEKVFKVNEAGRTYRKKGKKIQKERCLEKTGSMTLNSTVGSGYLSVRQPPDDNEPDNNSIVMPCVENQSSDLSRL